MRSQDNEQVFRQIASEYAERYGERLLEEQREISAGGAVALTPGMDSKVLGSIRARKRRRSLRLWGALAACLLLVVFMPRAADLTRNTSSSPAPAMQTPAASAASAPAAPAAPAAPPAPAEGEAVMLDQAAPESPASRQAQGQDYGAAAGAPEAAPYDEPPAAEMGGQYAAEPVLFALPEGYTLISSGQSYPRSVYLISDGAGNEISLAVEETDRQPETDGLSAVTVNGRTLYASDGEGSGYVTFSIDGVLYELTSESGVDILLELVASS